MQKKKPFLRFAIPFLVALFFISLLTTKPQRASWHEQWTWNILSPATMIFSWVGDSAGNIWNHYLFTVGAAKRAEVLETEVALLKQKESEFQEIAEENRRLHALLKLQKEEWPHSVAAKVVAFDPRAEFRSIRIDKGEEEGVRPNMPVVSAGGLVGKVGPVFKNEAIVLLVVDPANTIDVLVQRSRVRALLAGDGLTQNTVLKPGYFLSKLEYVKRFSDVQAADKIVTSGLDKLFPKGILVGEVESVENNRYGIFLEAKVVPSVDFSRLEEVLVLEPS